MITYVMGPVKSGQICGRYTLLAAILLAGHVPVRGFA